MDVLRQFTLQFSRRCIHTRFILMQKCLEKQTVQWWDSHYLLSRFNTVRVPFILNGIYSTGIKNITGSGDKSCLEGVKILEVGCGGGILCEELAKLGADVTGLDINAKVIEVAKDHQASDNLIKNNLRYANEPIYEHGKNNFEKYDVVVSSEVIEHVSNEEKEKYLANSINALKPGGSLFVTTINKTVFSAIKILFLAELFNIIPKGTHKYDEFLSPEDLIKMMEKNKCTVKSIEGMFYNPFTKEFAISSNKSGHYGIHAVKMNKT